ncbi:MAG: metallophosphoesterase [Candidatus Woesearchaeota archaeon]|nr:metallophosphoesterase [Candidatus Woesearchaeota archaeon]
MKILAFTDTHGNMKPLEHLQKVIQQEQRKKLPIDVAVCCGDFTIFGQKMKSQLKKMNDLGIPVVVIHGNHESASLVRKESALYKNITMVDRTMCRFGNTVFMGYGGGGFALTDTTFLRWGKEQFKKIKKDDKVVLLFHGPPHGTNLDLVGGGHCGNKDYTFFIREHHKQLYLVLAGHIHECNGQMDKIKDVVVANPGPNGRLFEIK